MQSLTRIRSIVIALLIFATSAMADVPPIPGFSNVSNDLILETSADLSAYRFFLESPMRVEEIKINAGSPMRIDAAGRGGAAKYAKLIAVPASQMTPLGELAPKQLEELIRKKAFANTRDVLSHDFQTTVFFAKAPFWSPPVYSLSLENGVVSAVKAPEGMGGAIPFVAVGVLITIGIAIIGLWLFRRSRKKV